MNGGLGKDAAMQVYLKHRNQRRVGTIRVGTSLVWFQLVWFQLVWLELVWNNKVVFSNDRDPAPMQI
jgi:hypothetical protein